MQWDMQYIETGSIVRKPALSHSIVWLNFSIFQASGKDFILFLADLSCFSGAPKENL
jgi:hypothetical protein